METATQGRECIVAGVRVTTVRPYYGRPEMCLVFSIPSPHHGERGMWAHGTVQPSEREREREDPPEGATPV